MEVSELTPEQRQEIKKVYESQLTAGDPGLSQEQAKYALFKLNENPTILEISKFWAGLEKSDDERISLEDFEKLRCACHEDQRSVLRWAFNKFDTNNDGTIDKSELEGILKTVYEDATGEFVDEEFVEQCMLMADSNNDGVLQIEEFVDMIIARTGKETSDS